MPYSDAVKAFMAKYRATAATNYPPTADAPLGYQPPIYIDEAVQSQGAGSANAQVRLPYAIVKDGGQKEQWYGESTFVTINHTLTLTFWYASDTPLEDCEAALAAAMYDGQASTSKAGLALCQLDLEAPLIPGPITVWPQGPYRRLGAKNLDNQMAWAVLQSFRLTYWRQPTYPV